MGRATPHDPMLHSCWLIRTSTASHRHALVCAVGRSLACKQYAALLSPPTTDKLPRQRTDDCNLVCMRHINAGVNDGNFCFGLADCMWLKSRCWPSACLETFPGNVLQCRGLLPWTAGQRHEHTQMGQPRQHVPHRPAALLPLSATGSMLSSNTPTTVHPCRPLRMAAPAQQSINLPLTRRRRTAQQSQHWLAARTGQGRRMPPPQKLQETRLPLLPLT